jgi:hypothetical protein
MAKKHSKGIQSVYGELANIGSLNIVEIGECMDEVRLCEYFITNVEYLKKGLIFNILVLRLFSKLSYRSFLNIFEGI